VLRERIAHLRKNIERCRDITDGVPLDDSEAIVIESTDSHERSGTAVYSAEP
jgi:hypothetical protein